MLHIKKLPENYVHPMGYTYSYEVWGIYEQDRLILAESLQYCEELVLCLNLQLNIQE